MNWVIIACSLHSQRGTQGDDVASIMHARPPLIRPAAEEQVSIYGLESTQPLKFVARVQIVPPATRFEQLSMCVEGGRCNHYADRGPLRAGKKCL